MKPITEHDHPEHHWKWTRMEIEWINERIKTERERCINVLKNKKIGFADQDAMLDEMIAEICKLGE